MRQRHERGAERGPAGTGAIATAVALLCAVTGAALAEVPSVSAPPENPVTEAKRVLGKILFWEEQLSADNTVACGTCHAPARNGTDARLAANPGADGVFGTADDVTGSPGVVSAGETGLYVQDGTFGLDRQVTGRAAPPAIMAMYSDELFWDGRASGAFRDPVTDSLHIARGGALESQAVGPPLSSVEMAHASRDWSMIERKLATAVPLVLADDLPGDVAAAIERSGSYPELFAAAYGDGAITVRRIAFAIATYERTLVADQTPWDRFRSGQAGALTGAALRGWQAFQQRQNACNECHTAPLFTDDSFRNIGLRPVAEDRGRQNVTGNAADRGRFKVPSLRNVGLKRTFMHNGRITSLENVLRFYAHAPGVQQFTDNQDSLIGPLRIPPQTQADIVAFLRTGLTDPRVAAETFPFDRPRLHSERATANPLLTETGRAGAGGRVPRMIAVSPPNLGNELFQLAVDGATPGATASLVMSRSAPVSGVVADDVVVATLSLGGSGAGDGHASALWPVADDAGSAGDVLWFQWRVVDAAAPGGVALSRVARVTLEGRTVAPDDPVDPEPPVEPDPVVVVAADGALYATRAGYVVDWKSHAAGVADDELTIEARINPRGAESAAGAVVSLTVGDTTLVTTGGLAANGVARGEDADGVRYKAKLDLSRGALSLRVRGLDLRAVTDAANVTGSGTAPLDVAVRIAGIGLESPDVAGTLELAYRTKQDKATRAQFRFGRERALNGLFGLQSVAARERSGGAYRVAMKGVLVPEGGGAAAPSGPMLLTIGDADAIAVPLSALRQSADGGFALDPGAAGIAGLRTLAYDASSRRLKIVTGDLDSPGLPGTGALETDVTIRLSVPLGTESVAFETVVRLRRKTGTSAKWRL